MDLEAIDLEHFGATLDQISQLPIAQLPLRGVLYGENVTRDKGIGYDPDGVRPYEFGDDPRRINMAVSARSTTGEYFTQLYYAEKAPYFYIASDVLGQRFRSGHGLDARKLGIGVAMTSALMATADRMPTSVLWSNGRKIDYDEGPASHIDLIADRFQQARKLARSFDEPKDGTVDADGRRLTRLFKRGKNEATPSPELTLKDLLRGLGNVALDESYIMVISDFRDVKDPLDEDSGWFRPLRDLTEGREVLAVELTNPLNFELPDTPLPFRDPLTNEVRMVDNSPAAREHYHQIMLQRSETIQRAIGATGARHIVLDTSEKDWNSNFQEKLNVLQ